jgi:hypothetical protein
LKDLTAQQAAVLLQQPQATSSLASAVASSIKVWSHYASGAGISGQRPHYASVFDTEVLAALPHIVASLLLPVREALAMLGPGSTASNVSQCNTSSSCSRDSDAAKIAAVGSTAAVPQQQLQQQRCSGLLLAVLLARSLVVLADAAEAAAARAGVPADQCLAA